MLTFLKISNFIWYTWMIGAEDGMSGYTHFAGLYLALCSTALMNYQSVWWNTHNTDVNPHTNVKDLPFKYSDLYAYCRNDIIFCYYKWYFLMMQFSGIPWVVGSLCFFYTDVMGENGQTFGYWMNGITGVFQITIAHHILLFVRTNNIDVTYLFWFPFSFMWLWVIGALDDVDKNSVNYMSIYTNLLRSPIFWLQTICFTGMLVIPIYFWLKWRQFFGGDPRHDFVYRAKFQASKRSEIGPTNT